MYKDKDSKIKNFVGSKKFFIISGITPLYIILIGLTIFPFIANLYMSFVDYYLVSETKGQFIFFENYLKLITDKNFWKILANTFYFSAGAVSLELGIGLFISLLLNLIKEKIKYLRVFIILPLAIASVAAGYAWFLIMEPSIGILNYFLNLLGIQSLAWFSSPFQVIPALILVDAWQWTPFIILLLTGAMLAAPVEPYESAMVDGANYFQLARYITIPLIKPTIIFAVILRFIDAFKIFDIIFIITKGGPGNFSETLSLKTFYLGFNRLQMGQAAALSIMVLIILFFIFQFIVKRSRIFPGD